MIGDVCCCLMKWMNVGVGRSVDFFCYHLLSSQYSFICSWCRSSRTTVSQQRDQNLGKNPVFRVVPTRKTQLHIHFKVVRRKIHIHFKVVSRKIHTLRKCWSSSILGNCSFSFTDLATCLFYASLKFKIVQVLCWEKEESEVKRLKVGLPELYCKIFLK